MGLRIHESVTIGSGPGQDAPARGDVVKDVFMRRRLESGMRSFGRRLERKKDTQASDPGSETNGFSRSAAWSSHDQFQKGFNAVGSRPSSASSTMCSPRRSQLTKWPPASGWPSSAL